MNTTPQSIIGWIVSRTQRIHRMAPRDQVVWSQFASALTPKANHVFYDLRLGEGRTPSETMSPLEAELYKTLTQYRIDVVVIAPNAVFLIEVKDQVQPGLIGQLMLYHQQILKSPLAEIETKLLCICATSHPDVEQTCSAHGWPVVQLDETQRLKSIFGDVVNFDGPTQ